MSKKQAVQVFNNELHISHSQIFTYLNCSLKYKFQNVERRQPERVSIALSFGSAIHSAIEMYYRSLKNKNQIEALSAITERFEDCLLIDLDNIKVPIIYKKNTPDKAATIEMGKAMLEAFYMAKENEPKMEIIGIELPLSAILYDTDGQPTDFKLTGIIDLLICNEKKEIIVVDNKTAAQSIAQSTADKDNQMAAYSYLLASNKYIFPTAPVKCRFDVLRKLKKPKFEQVDTQRTARDRKRFAKIANSVLAGIDAQIFIPQQSWMCGDCGYKAACKSW